MIGVNNFTRDCITYSQMNMIFNSRIYYRRIVALTRSYMRNRYLYLGAEDVLFRYLYEESIRLGIMLYTNFGRTNMDQYSLLLSQFAISLRDLISAQIAGNMEQVNQNVQKLYDNINKRAAFKTSMNPYWSEGVYKNLYDTYIQELIGLANAYASQNFDEVIVRFDRLNELSNKLGDIFAEGVNNYMTSGSNIPESGPCITFDQMLQIQNIRTFWFDLAVLVRTYMINRILGAGNDEATYNRLQKLIIDYTNYLKPIYGEKLAADLLKEFREYLDLIKNFITARQAGNTDEINQIIQLLDQNVAKRASLQASAVPWLNENDWRNRLYSLQVQGVVDESTALLAGDITRSFEIFTNLLDQAEAMSGVFAQSLFNFYTQIQ